MNEFDQLKLKFITDANFRKQVLEDPSTALQSVGMKPSDELLSVLQDLRNDLARLAEILEVEIDSV